MTIYNSNLGANHSKKSQSFGCRENDLHTVRLRQEASRVRTKLESSEAYVRIPLDSSMLLDCHMLQCCGTV